MARICRKYGTGDGAIPNEHATNRRLVMTSLPLAALVLTLSFSIFFAARNAWHLPLPPLQTLVFVTLVFSGQGTVYLVRQRHHFWRSRPSLWMLTSSAADIIVVSLLATHGILMAAVSTNIVAGVLLAVALSRGFSKAAHFCAP